MFLRIFIALAFVCTANAVTLAVCQAYCSSVQGGSNEANCSPWISFATQLNQTCFNLCVQNCFSVYAGSCMTNTNFKCCLNTTPTKVNEFKSSGCDLLYNNQV